MIKKFIAVFITIVLILSLTACNYNMFDTAYEYNYAYVKWSYDSTEKIEILKWAEDETTITLTTKDGRIICTDQQNIILVKE